MIIDCLSLFEYIRLLKHSKISYNFYIIDLQEVMNKDVMVYIVDCNVGDYVAPRVRDNYDETIIYYVSGNEIDSGEALEVALDCLNCDETRNHYLAYTYTYTNV